VGGEISFYRVQGRDPREILSRDAGVGVACRQIFRAGFITFVEDEPVLLRASIVYKISGPTGREREKTSAGLILNGGYQPLPSSKSILNRRQC